MYSNCILNLAANLLICHMVFVGNVQTTNVKQLHCCRLSSFQSHNLDDQHALQLYIKSSCKPPHLSHGLFKICCKGQVLIGMKEI